MSDRLNHIGNRGKTGRLSSQLRHALAATVLIAMLVAAGPATIQAAQCPLPHEPRIPPAGGPVINVDRQVINIDKLKERLLEYKEGKDGTPGEYIDDIKLVFGDARAYVEQRAREAKQRTDQDKKLAVVLDIDETSLSNWSNIKANNFGFIKGGPCFEEPTLACGFDDWILKASAPAIAPALEFFKFAIDNNVAVFFITGRRHNQRQATLWNLDQAGFQGWAGLRTRPDDDHGSIVPFKSGEREKIANKGYAIIANIGDQRSDLVDKDGKDDKFVECGFKLPNPFYFID